MQTVKYWKFSKQSSALVRQWLAVSPARLTLTPRSLFECFPQPETTPSPVSSPSWLILALQGLLVMSRIVFTSSNLHSPLPFSIEERIKRVKNQVKYWMSEQINERMNEWAHVTPHFIHWYFIVCTSVLLSHFRNNMRSCPEEKSYDFYFPLENSLMQCGCMDIALSWNSGAQSSPYHSLNELGPVLDFLGLLFLMCEVKRLDWEASSGVKVQFPLPAIWVTLGKDTISLSKQENSFLPHELF